MADTPHTVTRRVPEGDLDALMVQALGDLQRLRRARLFISGGTGYIGRWLLESLVHANRVLELGLEAVVLTRAPERFAQACPHLAADPAITLVQGDVRHFSVPPGNFTHVVHAATDVVASRSPLEVFDVTVQGTQQVLALAHERGAGRVLLLSSGAVYGRFPDALERAPESLRGSVDVASPLSAYGLGKIATEWLGNAFGAQHGLACMSARVFAQVGPHLALDAQFAAGNFIRDALRGQDLVIQGDGTSLRSYMYASDLVAWLWAILLRGDAGAAYNVGSDQAVSIRGLAEAVARLAGHGAGRIQVLGRAAPGAAPDRYVPDTGLVRAALGLGLTVPLDDALRRTLDWYRPHFRA